VSDSKKVKASKPKETGSQEKPDLTRSLNEELGITHIISIPAYAIQQQW
jgi:hypothetical protein